MPDMAKVRDLMKCMRGLVIFLNDEEISDIGKVLQRAAKRLIKEQGA